MKKIVLTWSSGKDSAWTLHTLRQQDIEVSALLTALSQAADRERQLAESGLTPIFPL